MIYLLGAIKWDFNRCLNVYYILTSGVGDERIGSWRKYMYTTKEGETTGWKLYVKYMFVVLVRWT